MDRSLKISPELTYIRLNIIYLDTADSIVLLAYKAQVGMIED